LSADIGDQCLRAVDLDSERGHQRIFRVHNNVARLALQIEADGCICNLPRPEDSTMWRSTSFEGGAMPLASEPA
jgi:hypothetical protein